MSRLRTVRKIVTGVRAVDGAGVRLVRVFGHHDTRDFDPFLMLDAFDSTDPDDYTRGFPWHPHRGIETITYLVQGDIEHADSLENKGSILDGDCQWMTAGSGIIHQEMPKASDRMLGVQLWLNLPAKDKMTSPRYGDIKKSSIPVKDENGSKVHIIAGEYLGMPGAFQGGHVPATYLDVEVAAGQEWSFSNEPEQNLFIYILRGEGCFDHDCKTMVAEKHAVLFSEGDQFRVKASAEGIRFLLLSGKPLKEPIAWGGPIVMNTQAELDLAFKELDVNMFIKK